MIRTLAALLLTCLPLGAQALCEGRDLIETLPAPERAALDAAVAATPYGTGLYWRATRTEPDGAQTEFLLFGTYHFRHAETDAHLHALKPALDTVEAVYLEMSPGAQRALQTRMSTDPSVLFITDGPTMPDLLDEAEWQAFASAMEARGFPGVMAAKLKPVWASIMLGIGPCEARNGALTGNGIDQAIGAYAEARGTPTRSLEDSMEFLTLLETDPLEKQLDLLRLTLALPLDADDLSHTIRTRYLAQDVALIWEYSRLISLKHGGPTAKEDFDRFEEVLLEIRNRAWVTRLMAEAVGQRVLIAAGAGHWPGQAGVLQLLQERGFTLERLAF